MKSVGTSLKTHLAQTVTTLTVCWLIQRVDGTQYAFTALDVDLVVSGVTYKSIAGFSRSTIATGSTGEVDNLEVMGLFGDITASDMKAGKFDYASIFVFAVNWADVSMGIVRLRRGFLGECAPLPNGSFTAELRGMTQALVQEFGNVFQPMCRADLGDAKCKIPIKPAAWTADTVYASGTYVQAATQSTDAALIGIFLASGGTSGSSEPSWDFTVGNTTADGSNTWTSASPFRLLAEVAGTIDRHQFVATPLNYPAGLLGNTAALTFLNNVSAGTSIEISDGFGTISHTYVFDVGGQSAHDTLVAIIAGSSLEMTMTSDTFGIQLTNNSGKQGIIEKTGDTLSGIRIDDFSAAYLDGGTVSWITGLNAGTSMELKTYLVSGQIVVLWLGSPFPIAVGDRFFYYPGCDKRRDTCQRKFANILNFRGEPDMPGTDEMLSFNT